jgi:hypothetical protein
MKLEIDVGSGMIITYYENRNKKNKHQYER